MFCSNCGAKIDDKSTYCSKCGISTSKSKKGGDSPNERKYYVSSRNRVVALMLACFGFLGIAGLHRIYVGRLLTGVIYLFTFGIFFLGTLYDLYKICSESFKDSDGYPLFSDSSMKSNYYRRNPKTKPLAIVVAVVLAFFFMTGLIGAVGGMRHSHQETQETTSGSQKDVTDKGDKNKKKEGPVIDLPMDGTPTENITKTVKENLISYGTASVEYRDVKVDMSNGEANVTIYLQGARGLTAQGTLDTFNIAAKQEMAALYNINPGVTISDVKMVFFMQVVYRKDGSEENIPAYSIGMNKVAASKIHWKNYKDIDIMAAANEVQMHPSFRKLIQSNSRKSKWDESLETLGL